MLVPHSDLVEGLQPMEGAPVEPASTVDSQQVEDPPPMKFTWKIENFARLNIKKHYSEIFVVGGYNWRILIFPKGNNVEYLSMYLDVADSGTLPYGWSRYAQFSFTVVNQIHSKYTMRKDTQHQFNARESDWGFTSFMPLSDLYDPSRGYLVNDAVVVEAEVSVLQIRVKKEQEEKEAQAHLYTIIKVARDEDLAEQIGRDIYFDLVDHDKVRSFRIQKQTPFNLFKEEVAKYFGIPVQFQRFWIWAKRQNHTYRPFRPLTPQEESQSIGQLREVSNKTHNAELKLFLEVDFGPDQRLIPPPDKTKEDILLFFKLYEPDKRELRFVGRLFVKSSSKPIEILAKLNQMAGLTPKVEIELYEEIRFEPCIMCEHLDKSTSFRLSQIGDGDIICFQKSTPHESEECKYPDVPSFLEYVHNRQIVHFRSLEKPKEDDFSLELSKLHTYDDVVGKVAHQIGLDDPTKIRLTAHNCYSQQPKPQPIKYRGVEHLTDMLVHYNQRSDILYYEVLDIPLPGLQALKNLKVAFHHATEDEVVIHNIRLPKQSTVEDVINVLKTKGLGLSECDLEIGQASDSQNDPALTPDAMEEPFDHFQGQTVTEEETSPVLPQDLPPSADVAAATEDLSPAACAKLLIQSWISDCQHQLCSHAQLDEAIEAVGVLVTEGVLDDDGGSIMSESIRSYHFQQARAVQAQEEASQAKESLQTLAAARSTRDRAVQASILKTDELRVVDERIADLEARLQVERAVRAKVCEDLNGFSTEVHSLDGTIQDLEARGSAFDVAIQAGQSSVARLDLAYKHLKVDFEHVL